MSTVPSPAPQIIGCIPRTDERTDERLWWQDMEDTLLKQAHKQEGTATECLEEIIRQLFASGKDELHDNHSPCSD
jgi:hypothetical protein